MTEQGSEWREEASRSAEANSSKGCLAVVGIFVLLVIALFSIPKVTDELPPCSYARATTKEAAGMIADAYEKYREKNKLTANTRPTDLTQYMNYVTIDTVSKLENFPCYWNFCLRLHNGGLLFVDNGPFGGSDPKNNIRFVFQPENISTQDKSKCSGSVTLVQYYGGKLTTGSYAGLGEDPEWFQAWN